MTSNQIHKSEDWVERFSMLYEETVQKFSGGVRNAKNLFSQEDRLFLTSIGASTQEIYDFIEDWCDAGEPDPDTVLRITAIRREYFLTEQHGQLSTHTISMSTLPSMEASLGGLRWLPRIIKKAQAKLRGEMPPELMYGCGGDRPFLKKIKIDPADFLQLVWDTHGNPQRILDAIQHVKS